MKVLALDEHSVIRGAIWGITSLDQWGVEFGTERAQRATPELGTDTFATLGHDRSTNAHIGRYRPFPQES